MNILISLSETDKRVIFILLLLIIVTLVIFGYIGLLITRIMRWQGKRVDQFTHDVVVTKVIDNKKDFVIYATKKNWVWFFKQAWKPLTVILLAFVLLVIHHAITRDWSYDLFDYKKTGFGTLLFIWDFNDPNIYKEFFGIRLIADWPPIISTPHWQWEAWCSYIFIPAVFIGGGWYLIVLQSVVARTIRIHQLKHSVFDKSLDNYNQNDPRNNIPNNQPGPINPTQPNNLNQ